MTAKRLGDVCKMKVNEPLRKAIAITRSSSAISPESSKNSSKSPTLNSRTGPSCARRNICLIPANRSRLLHIPSQATRTIPRRDRGGRREIPATISLLCVLRALRGKSSHRIRKPIPHTNHHPHPCPSVCICGHNSPRPPIGKRQLEISNPNPPHRFVPSVESSLKCF